MRLLPNEINSIHQYLKTQLSSYDDSQAWLFGSRLNDITKGGDIDICIVTALPETAALLRKRLHYFRSELRELLDDQRVDISIIDQQTAMTQPFWQQALKEAVAIL
ncbi:MAG: nucleotidyltransferase domain-containing protein [Deltaproteobacteria bacterium]|nr:nucleotidyltransferase domain-containing protein [Deltaproteobacteria bacterium]